jgi:hypothetical protein
MRLKALILVLAAAACTSTTSAPGTRLTPANSATELMVGGPLTMSIVTRGAPEGQDPVVTLTLARADGSNMRFQQGNHTNDDLMAQRPGGALAQVMGLFGEEAPMLYHAVEGGNGAPFLCGPEGPRAIGYYQAEDGEISMVGLKSSFEFETLADGSVLPLPYSPDHVCARLKFRAAP